MRHQTKEKLAGLGRGWRVCCARVPQKRLPDTSSEANLVFSRSCALGKAAFTRMTKTWSRTLPIAICSDGSPSHATVSFPIAFSVSGADLHRFRNLRSEAGEKISMLRCPVACENSHAVRVMLGEISGEPRMPAAVALFIQVQVPSAAAAIRSHSSPHPIARITRISRPASIVLC